MRKIGGFSVSYYIDVPANKRKFGFFLILIGMNLHLLTIAIWYAFTVIPSHKIIDITNYAIPLSWLLFPIISYSFIKDKLKQDREKELDKEQMTLSE